jgi:hypothetical protein
MAEINFNNLYNQLTPMEQDQYDGVFGSSGFKDKYAQNPNSLLVTQNSNYEKLKAVADAEAQVPETSMFGGMMDTLNPFSKLSAAEPDIYNSVPSYTPNNLPFTSMSDMYNLSQRDLVDQINMGPRSITPPMTMDQMMYGSVLSNNIASPRTVLNQQTGIMQQAPQGIFNDFYGSVYEPYNEEKDDEQVDYLPGQSSFKDKISNIGSSFMQKSGIGGLLGLITGNPILGLIGKGIGALANRAGPALNDFKSASTGAQFFQNLRDRRAREDAAARGAAKANMADARAITNRISKAKVSNQDSYRGGGGGGGGGAPSNTNSGGGTFGTSSNNSSFSDYS